MFEKLYGRVKDKDTIKSILDDVRDDIRLVSSKLSGEDKKLLDEHLSYVRDMERDLQSAEKQKLAHPMPQLDQGVINDNDNIPKTSKMQIELLVNSFQNDMARVATLQYTNSSGRRKCAGSALSRATTNSPTIPT